MEKSFKSIEEANKWLGQQNNIRYAELVECKAFRRPSYTNNIVIRYDIENNGKSQYEFNIEVFDVDYADRKNSGGYSLKGFLKLDGGKSSTDQIFKRKVERYVDVNGVSRCNETHRINKGPLNEVLVILFKKEL
ncbi:hypothetical protein DCCM_1978 [Desulfocucumis palustris]|uniref:Uncharacterized protein n=1 Tax=Desulfocucumis palustris TaxID=1898651 RepID=A0A2L2XG65_9FIRM|nr:hypothetical protein [Desulfocucumis palustris]GBF32881.1 hypothetical protein DCCM_1978 [Desulfocucumis palustris]